MTRKIDKIKRMNLVKLRNKYLHNIVRSPKFPPFGCDEVAAECFKQVNNSNSSSHRRIEVEKATRNSRKTENQTFVQQKAIRREQKAHEASIEFLHKSRTIGMCFALRASPKMLVKSFIWTTWGALATLMRILVSPLKLDEEPLHPHSDPIFTLFSMQNILLFAVVCCALCGGERIKPNNGLWLNNLASWRWSELKHSRHDDDFSSQLTRKTSDHQLSRSTTNPRNGA